MHPSREGVSAILPSCTKKIRDSVVSTKCTQLLPIARAKQLKGCGALSGRDCDCAVSKGLLNKEGLGVAPFLQTRSNTELRKLSCGTVRANSDAGSSCNTEEEIGATIPLGGTETQVMEESPNTHVRGGRW